ncbi:MAG: recombination protein RecO [Sulfurimonas sp. RIFCSPHIGHO2_12_FULL_36_9]|uniref:recombination protein RecO n=1 Tax=Sulfurimonas sp. RIFCSPLOWO2_12_36_12 TaxID=1802253 RepID=UPI0008D7DCD5|nr:recombination protein RecO [Sulfurimonas sp. RIFCSPLOWO2_12_36_12]OHD97422.1 MAG: recombination protein RecO [Sulfurimonas sp. RIFCSPLOWO2_02_FULL_36_28]OHD99656.1 MAG: recombination protein RecO [Sulfurimonas sp. RIFCSPHIGHO2_12_FULL_36_9]OHE01964.1 MAG: recombination protein RecO [Sulfurimonas sp. RIFCSPLOWO2_12_36_12]OHE07913.1 MAG: recombination protein RecO [Sulfurimonas sp. RIFCSPLOWO2_12_FULL_36_74]
MQGFILNLNRVKDEDLIVTIISRESLDTLYRFYGARHGVINLGFKVDYEKESSSKSNILRLKDVIHIGYKWINDYKLLRLWQDFSALFYKHLKDAEELDDFYFELLESASQNWNKQNPKRVAIESYIKLLEHEGRLHTEFECFICSETIVEDDVSLLRAFLPTHKECTHTFSVKKDALVELYKNRSTLFLNDEEIDRLWYLLLEGL